MSEAEGKRRMGLEIITELYELTCEMEKRLTNADFLILSVEKRQALINEYSQSRLQNEDAPPDEETMAEMKRLVKEIISRDTLITKALEEHKNTTQREIAILQQTRAAYLKKQNFQTGRRMDYKE